MEVKALNRLFNHPPASLKESPLLAHAVSEKLFTKKYESQKSERVKNLQVPTHSKNSPQDFRVMPLFAAGRSGLTSEAFAGVARVVGLSICGILFLAIATGSIPVMAVATNFDLETNIKYILGVVAILAVLFARPR